MIPAVEGNAEQIAQSKPDPQKRKLKEACQEFESLLTGYLFKSMRQSVVRAEEPDQANQIYEGMMDETLAKELSRSGSGGLADILYRELLPLIQTASKEKRPPLVTSQGLAEVEASGSHAPEIASTLSTDASDGPEPATQDQGDGVLKD
jgi:Rod binding domain-containing protein